MSAVVAGLALILLAMMVVWRPQPTPVVTPTPTPSNEPSTEPVDNVLGHLPYNEAPAADLIAISSDGRLRLRKAAAEQFLAMQRAARSAGVTLTPISAFRTVQEQDQLFFAIKQQRNQETRQRAEVSAPPGYSEHHTGYAVDIGDGQAPATNLQISFENTQAFKWLENNAAKYSFELSFTADNPQGISYEPWHWRFVGDRQSLELFYRARNLPQ